MALSEIQHIKAVQNILNTRPDGDPGRHTWSCFYLAMEEREKVKTPYAIRAFGQNLYIAKPEKSNPFMPKGKGVISFRNTISGSFSWDREPISIMVSNGKVLRWHSCHYWCGYPESVLCYYNNGTHAVHRVKYVKDIPNWENLRWAIGGAGMGKNFNPVAEGFYRLKFEGSYYYFGDVWRNTDHIIIGFDSFNYLNIVNVTRLNKTGMTALAVKLGLIDYILLDGGHVTACNVDGHRDNIYQKQYYAIQLG